MAKAPARRAIIFNGPGGGISGGFVPSSNSLSELSAIEVDGLIGNYYVDSGGTMAQDSRSSPQNLSGSVAYSSYSNVSNSTESISGISNYTKIGSLVRCYSPDGDGFGTDFDTNADGSVIFVSAPSASGSGTSVPDRRLGIGNTNIGVIYEFNRDGYQGVVQIYDPLEDEAGNETCSLIANPYNGTNEVGIITGRVGYPFLGKEVQTNKDGTIIAAKLSKVEVVINEEVGIGTTSQLIVLRDKVVVYQRGRSATGSPNYVRISTLEGSDDASYAGTFTMSGDGKMIFVNCPEEKATGCGGAEITGRVYAYERNKREYTLLGVIDIGEIIGPSDSSQNFGLKLATNLDGSILAASDENATYILNRNKEYYDNYYIDGCDFDRPRDKHPPYIVTRVLSGVSPLDMSDDGRAIIVSESAGNVKLFFSNGKGNNYTSVSELDSFVPTYGSITADGKTIALSTNSLTKIYNYQRDELYLVCQFATSGKTKLSSDGNILFDGAGDFYGQERETYVYADASGNIGIGTPLPSAKLDVNGNVKVGGDVILSAGGKLQGNATGLTGSPSITVGAINAVSLSVSGSKSFDIPHPIKEGWRLKYICLEGPSADVYIRGKLEDSNVIELPDYWSELVDQETIMVNLTPFGVYQELFVEKIEWGSRIIVKNNLSGPINCSYVVYAERKDVDRNQSEYQA
jgi:hypothetical protein